MYPRLFPCLALILGILLSPTYAHAQQDTRDTNAALRQKAFDLLESVAGQLSTLQSAENRARLGANIVDSLWKHDEKRARALLVLVQQDIISGLEVKQNVNAIDRHTFQVFFKLRIDTVERIAKYDGELALEFLRSTEPRFEKELRRGEQHLELKLARQIAANNPDVALKVGRKWLEQGFSNDIVSLLTQLNKKHKEQALIFYKEIVRKLKDEDLSSNWAITNFVETLAKFKPPEADAATFGELVGLIVTSALSKGCANKTNEEDEGVHHCRWAASIVPRMEKIDPRGAKLTRWVGERNNWGEYAQFTLDLTEVEQDGTANDILALETKYPDRVEYIVYRAVQKVRADGDLEQARKIANRLPDSANRRHIHAQLDTDEKWAKIDDEKLAEVEAKINAIENLQERVGALLNASAQLGSRNQKVAFKLLNQANEIIDTMKPGKEQTAAQIAVALMYCSEKNDRGLSLMESLVPKLNELVDLAVKLDGFDTRYLREGEWNMSANGAVGQVLTALAENAGYFAWCDFDRAVSLAGRFDRAEIRLMAQVKLAQAILAGPPKRGRMEYRMFRN